MPRPATTARKPATALLAAAAFLVLSGCATITGGTRTNMSIETDPEDATATVGTVQCETPCTMSVARDASRIMIEKDGYETLNLELDKEFRAVPTILGNILWLPVGLAVDFIVGGAWDVRPVDLRLDREDGQDVLRVELAPRAGDEEGRARVLPSAEQQEPQAQGHRGG